MSHHGCCSVAQCVLQSIPVHTSSLAHVHCSESFLCCMVSGFCGTINTGLSPGLLLVTLLLPCVMKILQLYISSTGPLMHPIRLQMIEILGWASWVLSPLIHPSRMSSLACSCQATQCCDDQEAGSALLLSCSQGLLSHTLISRSSSTVLPSQGRGHTLPSAAVQLGQLSCLIPSGLAHKTKSSPPALSPLCCTDKMQDLLFRVLQPVR